MKGAVAKILLCSIKSTFMYLAAASFLAFILFLENREYQRSRVCMYSPRIIEGVV